jgi:hypothetical protein
VNLDNADDARPTTGPVARERALRRTVSRAGGCLGDLSRPQRRVLSLRAGVGPQPARSRRSVARRLDISVSRVARLETTGLSRLRALAGGGACGAPTLALAGTTASRTTADDGAAAARGSATGGAGVSRGRGERRDERSRDRGSGDACGVAPSGSSDDASCGGADAGGVESVTRTNRPPVATQAAGGLDLTIPLILLLMAASAFVVARVLRRELAPEALQHPPADPDPPSVPRWDDPPPGV